tara:strand:+ start:988 stop:1314 length:327 start_codon:yes stop_codon:yes gene_type:complete
LKKEVLKESNLRLPLTAENRVTTPNPWEHLAQRLHQSHVRFDALTQTPHGVSRNQRSSVCLCADEVSQGQVIVSEFGGNLGERVLYRESEVKELGQGFDALLSRRGGG